MHIAVELSLVFHNVRVSSFSRADGRGISPELARWSFSTGSAETDQFPSHRFSRSFSDVINASNERETDFPCK